MRQHQQNSEELLREAAKILVDGVRLQILGDIERKLISASTSQGEVETSPRPAGCRPFDPDRGIDLYEEMRQYEIQLIRWALQEAHGKQVIAAKLLGIRPTTLNNKIKQYRLDWKEEASAQADTD